jgi:hypothetical protein
MSQARGENSQPSSVSKPTSGWPNQPATCCTPQLPIASSDMNATSIAPTFNASCRPVVAPFAAASITLTLGS